MYRLLPLTVIGLVAFTGSALAAPATATPMSAWASGRIERVDPAAHTLVVADAGRQTTFVLSPHARLREGTRALSPADLGSDVGRQVRIRYAMHGAERLADQVDVTTARPHRTGK